MKQVKMNVTEELEALGKKSVKKKDIVPIVGMAIGAAVCCFFLGMEYKTIDTMRTEHMINTIYENNPALKKLCEEFEEGVRDYCTKNNTKM